MKMSYPNMDTLQIYFIFVFLLSIPFWLLGQEKLPLPMNLPVSALTAFTPSIAAAVLFYRKSGFKGVKDLLNKAIDHKKVKNKFWYLPTVFLAPFLYFLSYALMDLLGLSLPERIIFPIQMVPVFFLLFVIPAMGEELGWSGYAIEQMQNRWSVFKASLILGIVWAIWHSIPFIQTDHSASWVVWQCTKTIAMRIVIVWIFNNTGKSVLAAILYHTTDNVSWSLFPNYGSHYDSFIASLVTWIAAIILLKWGASTLSRKQNTRAIRIGDTNA